MQHLAKALEHLNEPAMLTLGEVGIDDIVVQEFGSGIRRNGEELVARAVDEDRAQRADFGGDVNWQGGKITGRGRREAVRGRREARVWRNGTEN